MNLPVASLTSGRSGNKTSTPLSISLSEKLTLRDSQSRLATTSFALCATRSPLACGRRRSYGPLVSTSLSVVKVERGRAIWCHDNVERMRFAKDNGRSSDAIVG
jgi:hypothetical protein